MILQDLKESPEPLEVAKSWISDSLGPQTARVTAQPKRNWPSPFEAAAAEVVANWEGLCEQPAIVFHPQKGFKFDFFGSACVQGENPEDLFDHLFPSWPFLEPGFFSLQVKEGKKKRSRNSSEKHLFSWQSKGTPLRPLPQEIAGQGEAPLGSHDFWKPWGWHRVFRTQSSGGHIFWWPSAQSWGFFHHGTTNHLKLQPKQQLANVIQGY